MEIFCSTRMTIFICKSKRVIFTTFSHEFPDFQSKKKKKLKVLYITFLMLYNFYKKGFIWIMFNNWCKYVYFN